MKRLLLGSFLFLGAFALRADEFIVFDAQTTNCDPCINTGDGFNGVYDLSGFSKSQVQFSSTAGSVATCTVYTKSTATDPWGEAFHQDNPGTATIFYIGPGAGYIKLAVSSYGSGTLKGTIKRTK